MIDDQEADFLREVRAVLGAAPRPIDTSLDVARRVGNWLRDNAREIPPLDEVSDDEVFDGE